MCIRDSLVDDGRGPDRVEVVPAWLVGFLVVGGDERKRAVAGDDVLDASALASSAILLTLDGGDGSVAPITLLERTGELDHLGVATPAPLGDRLICALSWMPSMSAALKP